MLDKKLLEHWREYQEGKRKRKMAEAENGHICDCAYLYATLPEATLCCGEQQLVVSKELAKIEIQYEQINGYSINGNTITLRTNVMQDVTFTFQSRVAFRAALLELKHFLRERHLVPTPPSSPQLGLI